MENICLRPGSHKDLFDEKAAYLSSLTAPLDGMWESALMPREQHYNILQDNVSIGYCIVNSEHYLMQLSAPAAVMKASLLQYCIDQLSLQGAYVATCEPGYLSLCMDLQKSVQVVALMYREVSALGSEVSCEVAGYQFKQLKPDDFACAFQFGMDAQSPDPDWLNAYYASLLERGELFGFWHQGELAVAGECRVSETQLPYADVGMVVGKEFRKKGLAGSMLLQLRKHCSEAGLKAICSTEQSNVGSQKAIANAGFISEHRILEITFS